jgi:chaperonin GroES
VSKFPIRLFENRVAVRKDDQSETTPGGIIIPGKAQDKPIYGTVVAVGPGMMKGDGTRVPMNVEVGDRVVFGEHRASVPFKHEGVNYSIFFTNDFIGVVEEEEGEEPSVSADARREVEVQS